MLTKDNVTIGIEWRFGPDWPGQRCGARTRRGTACQRPANNKNGRCRLHGGARGRAIRKELRQMERELIAGGLLDKHWRDSFLS